MNSLSRVKWQEHRKFLVGVGLFTAGVVAVYLNNRYHTKQYRAREYECLVCMESKPTSQFPKVTNRCEHAALTCLQCLHSYVDITLRSKRDQQLNCPHRNCSETMRSEDVLRTCGPIMQQLFIHLQQVCETIKHPNFRHCAGADCSNALIITPIPNPDLASTLLSSNSDHTDHAWECQNCKTINCFLHRSVLGQCEMVPSELTPESEQVQLSRACEDFSQCPNCQMGISKNGGCPHMKCTWCSNEFCWQCKSAYHNGFCSHSPGCIYFWADTNNDQVDMDYRFIVSDLETSDHHCESPWWSGYDELNRDIDIITTASDACSAATQESTSWITSFFASSDLSSKDVVDVTSIVLETVWNSMSHSDSDDDLEQYWKE